MSPNLIAKQVQTCEWRGIPIAGIKAGPCTREATLTGQNNGGGEQHLCTQHMRQRALVGYGYTFVWPCAANGWTYYDGYDYARPLSAAAKALTR